jgi:hypothetical protein
MNTADFRIFKNIQIYLQVYQMATAIVREKYVLCRTCHYATDRLLLIPYPSTVA